VRLGGDARVVKGKQGRCDEGADVADAAPLYIGVPPLPFYYTQRDAQVLSLERDAGEKGFAAEFTSRR